MTQSSPPPFPPPQPATGDLPAVATAFCPGCGSAWNPLWVECPRCAAKTKARRDATVARNNGSMLSSLALYFTLLVVSASAIAAVRYYHIGIWAMFAAQIIDAVIVLAWCTYDRKDVLPALLKSPWPPVYGLAVVGAICTFTIAMCFTTALGWFVNEGHATYGDPFFQAGYGWFAVILSVCVQPAIIEELAFRGVVLTGMQRVLSDREAILVSAGLFMVLHLSVLSFPHLFIIGAVLAVLRLKTGSLYPGMLLHFTHNLLCVGQEHFFR